MMGPSKPSTKIPETPEDFHAIPPLIAIESEENI